MLVSQCVCVCFDYTTLSLGPDVPSSVFELEANLFHFMCFWIREKQSDPNGMLSEQNPEVDGHHLFGSLTRVFQNRSHLFRSL